MGYTIRYGPRSPREIAAGKKTLHPFWGVLIVAALVLTLRFAAPQAAGKLRSILLPGFDDGTAAAFSQMMERIGAGERIDASVTAFCQEVISNGDMP